MKNDDNTSQQKRRLGNSLSNKSLGSENYAEDGFEGEGGSVGTSRSKDKKRMRRVRGKGDQEIDGDAG
jgi:hypothetical protein